MSKMTEINKANLIAIRPQIDEALKELGERLGLSFHVGNGGYAGNAGHFKLEIKVDDPAVQEAAARKLFEQHCYLFGLEPSDYGLEFDCGRGRYRLTGLHLSGPKSAKFPLKVRDLATNADLLMGEISVLHIKAARPVKVEAA